MARHGVFTDPDRFNAAELLIVRGAPMQPALVSAAGCLSYRQLRKATAQAAAAWQARGVGIGELVMLRGDLGPDHVVAFLGAIWAGAVPVPLRIQDHEGRPTPVTYAVQQPGGAPPTGATWAPWLQDLLDQAPVPAAACDAWAPACWTEPRSWQESGAIVLPHRFALALNAQPGTLPLAQAGTMLGVLRALRRGVTAVLQQLPPRPAHAMMPAAIA